MLVFMFFFISEKNGIKCMNLMKSESRGINNRDSWYINGYCYEIKYKLCLGEGKKMW